MDIPKEFIADKIALVNSLRLPKRATVSINRSFRFNYVPLDDMMDAIKQSEEFSKKFAVTFDCECQIDDSKNNIIVCVTAILTHISGYVERTAPAKWILPAFDKDGAPLNQQKQGSAISYCKRYALGAMLGVSADEDTDTEEQHPELRQKKQEGRQEGKQQTAAKAKEEMATEAQMAQIADLKHTALDVLGVSAAEFVKTIKGAFNGALPWGKDGAMTKTAAAKLIDLLDRNNRELQASIMQEAEDAYSNVEAD